MSKAAPPDGIDFSIGETHAVGDCIVTRLAYTRKNEIVAVKLMRSEEKSDSVLSGEIRILKALSEIPNNPVYVPKVYGARKLKTTDENQEKIFFDAMAMELFGNNLEDIQKEIGRFNNYSTSHLGIKLVTALQGIHSAGFVICDLKPRDIAIRRDDINEIGIIEFGNATEADPPSEFPSGEFEFMSINAHNGSVVGKLQDFESLFYILLKCAVGTLPWEQWLNGDEEELIFQFKVTLLNKLSNNPDIDYAEAEKNMVEECGEEAKEKLNGLIIKLTEYPGLLGYAEAYVKIFMRENENQKQNITVQDYVDLLAGLDMGKFKVGEERKLDWVDKITPGPKSPDIDYIDNPTFSLEEGVSITTDGEDVYQYNTTMEDEMDDDVADENGEVVNNETPNVKIEPKENSIGEGGASKSEKRKGSDSGRDEENNNLKRQKDTTAFSKFPPQDL